MRPCDARGNHQYCLPLSAVCACVCVCVCVHLPVCTHIGAFMSSCACVIYFVGKNMGSPLISVPRTSIMKSSSLWSPPFHHLNVQLCRNIPGAFYGFSLIVTVYRCGTRPGAPSEGRTRGLWWEQAEDMRMGHGSVTLLFTALKLCVIYNWGGRENVYFQFLASFGKLTAKPVKMVNLCFNSKCGLNVFFMRSKFWLL